MERFKSSSVIALIVILLVGGGVYALVKNNSKDATPAKNIPKETAKPASTIDPSLSKEVKYSAPDKYTVFKVTYPKFTNASSAFNIKIAELVNAGIDQQKNDAAPAWQARYDTRSPGDKITEFPAEADKFYFDVSWKPVQENENFISFILTVNAYAGGAHGYETVTSFNYDVANKQEIELADLFPNDPEYLQTISDFARKDLTAQFRKRLNVVTKDDEKAFVSVLEMLNDGTTPDIENFSVFTFTPDKVTFYFNQYQVAPYSMGQSTVVMKRN